MKFETGQVFVSWLAVLGALAACSSDGAPSGQKEKPVEPAFAQSQAPAVEDGAVLRSKQLVAEAYALKHRGENAAALSLFEAAHDILAPNKGERSFEIASNLDDQASVRMRMGDYARARAQYTAAKAILAELKPDDESGQRLAEGVDFRLKILTEFEKQRIFCREPAAAAPSGNLAGPDAGSPSRTALPYFPDKDEMNRDLGKLNESIRGCGRGPASPILVRLVITGQGRVVLADIANPNRDAAIARCIEDGLINAAAGAKLPRFGACFRLFNYLYKTGGV